MYIRNTWNLHTGSLYAGSFYTGTCVTRANVHVFCYKLEHDDAVGVPTQKDTAFSSAVLRGKRRFSMFTMLLASNVMR